MEQRTGTKTGPDKGWSWVIALAACFNSLVLAGIFRTGGVLFVAFIDAFGVTREEASWPMVICISVLNLTGPFSGILGQRYGIRPVVMAGAVVGALGVSACFFTTSLEVITILFGGVFGIGYGLVNTLMPVIVNSYFLDLRGLANGIANSGSCFGSVILPVLFEFLISHYGLSACFLLTGGIVLNVAVAGALLRPPSWLNKDNNINLRNQVNSDVQLRHTNSFQDSHSIKKNSSQEDNSNLVKPVMDHKENTHFNSPYNLQHYSLHTELVEALKKRPNTNDKISSDIVEYKDPTSDSLLNTSSSPNVDAKNQQNGFQTELFRAQQEFQDSINDFQNAVLSILETSQSEEVLNSFDETSNVKTSDITDSCPARHSFSISSMCRPRNKLNKAAILNTRPLKKSNLKFENSSMDSISVPSAINNGNSNDVYDHRSVSLTIMDNIKEEERPLEKIESQDCKESRSVLQSFKQVLSCPMFYVTALTNVSFYFLFHMYVVIIVDYSKDCGVPDSDTKYVIFAFSAADLFGRLCLGWVTDRKYVTRSRFVMVCMTAIAMVFFVFPFAVRYWSLILASCGYGVLLGCTMIVFPILLVDYLGTEVHAVAYGCLCFLNGFASLVRPLIIGYFRDSIGSYANMFYILGLISLVASSAWLLERCFLPKNTEDRYILDDDNVGYTKQINLESSG